MLFTYKAFNNQTLSYPNDHDKQFALPLQAYMLLLEFLKAEWEAAPSAFRATSSLAQTSSLPLRLGFKLSPWIKHLVRDGSGHPEPSLSYSAIGLGYCGLPMMH